MDLKTLVRANKGRTAAVVLGCLGLLVLLIGYIGISGTGLAAEQAPYLVSGGMLGLALIGLGATAWLSADLQDDWRKLDALEEAVRELAAARGDADLASVDDLPDADDVLVAEPTTTRAPAQRRRAARTADAGSRR